MGVSWGVVFFGGGWGGGLNLVCFWWWVGWWLQFPGVFCWWWVGCGFQFPEQNYKKTILVQYFCPERVDWKEGCNFQQKI